MVGRDVVAVEELQVVARRLVLGEVLSDVLPDAATEALSRGVESPALVELACLSARDVRAGVADARGLFEMALAELGLAMPSKNDARKAVRRQAAQRLASDAPVTADCLHEIYWQTCYITDDPDHARLVNQWLSLWLSWVEQPANRPELEPGIRAAATNLAAATVPSAHLP